MALTNPTTYKQFVETFGELCLSHIGIKHFQVGQPSDIDMQTNIETFQRYPFCFLIPENAEMDRFGKFVLTFTFVVGDIAVNEEDLQVNTHNNCLMIMQDQLRKQAPDNPDESGSPLRNSVTVKAVETKDGIQMRVGYLTYGRFLDSGTGRYRKPNPDAPFNPKPGKGRGGIKPRYWTNLGKATTAKIAKIIKTELTTQIRKSFKK